MWVVKHFICVMKTPVTTGALPRFQKNESGRIRTLSAMGFLEIILGDVRSKTNIHVFSEQDKNTGALLFRNRYNSAFAERVSYFKVEGLSLIHISEPTRQAE